MRLNDLEPKWITLQGWSSPKPFYVGVSFFCPHCSPTASDHGPLRRRRLAVMFHPPIDPAGAQAEYGFDLPDQGHRRVTGETFETLTLAPSVNFNSIGHWHGTIKAGECHP